MNSLSKLIDVTIQVSALQSDAKYKNLKTKILPGVLLFILFIMTSHSGSAKTTWKKLSMPSKIVTQQSIQDSPSNWTVLKPSSPNHLAGVRVFAGHPEKLVSLKPEKIEEQKHHWVAFWKLMPKDGKVYWISLSYGLTTLELSQPLPQGTSELRVTYDNSVKISGLNEIVSVEYRF